MKRGWLKLREFIDKAIFPALILLFVIIILEFFYKTFTEEYYFYIEIIDVLIILIFIIDLIFKYLNVRNVPKFFRKYWLELIAVLPLFWVFRAFEGFASIFGLLGETTKEGQQILHIGVEIARGEEGVAIVTKTSRFERFLEPLSRLFRFFKMKPDEYESESKKYLKDSEEYLKFFEKPVEREAKEIFKEAKFETKKIKKLIRKV